MRAKPRQKVFCIGCGKTGTTSLAAALESLGFQMGDQAQAELLIEDWAVRDFRRIVELCETADAFQDIPFSLDHTYHVLDYEFPDSKFILTIRGSSDEWYDSLVRFHTQLIGKGRIPTADELKASDYRQGGWIWRAQVLIFGADETSLYDRDRCIAHYETHCNGVLDYFQNRQNDLLVLNLADPLSMKSLCGFVDVPWAGQTMPHLNRSRQTA